MSDVTLDPAVGGLESEALDEILGVKAKAAKKEDRGWVPLMPECWKIAEALISAGTERVLLHGIPGTGKSYAGKHYGVASDAEVVSIYVREDSAEYQIVGSDVFHKDGSTGWRNGPALIALIGGQRLLVNEMDRASGDAVDAFLGICDDPKSAGWMLPTGERVKPAPGFQTVATMNAAYEELIPALRDRFVMRVEITHPHPEAIADLPEPLRKLAWQLSHAGVDESQRMSIRAFREFGRAVERGIPVTYALQAAFAHRAEEMRIAIDIDALTAPGIDTKKTRG